MLDMRAAVCTLSACLLTIIGCPDPGPQPSPDGAILSDPVDAGVALTNGGVSGLAFKVAAQATGNDIDVAYISLEPESYEGGRTARILSPRLTGGAIQSLMIEGGLDPVPVPAFEGDTIELEILGGGNISLDRKKIRVPPTRRPKVVRTIPPRGKTDVAVNSVIVIIFSEPVAANSLPGSIELRRGNTVIAGSVNILQGVTAAVAFQPTVPLEPNTAYRLVVQQTVRDLDGDPLQEPVSVDFTVGTSYVPNIGRLVVLPDTVALAANSRVQLLVQGFAGDDTTSVPLPIGSIPVLWSSDNPSVASVSSTGLVTAVGEGVTPIRARYVQNVDITDEAVTLVSGSLAPVATLEILPAGDTVPVTGKIELTTVTRDAAGNVVRFRPTEWSTTNSAIATVEPAGSGRAWVVGIAAGRTSVIATSEGRSDTMVVDVATPGPYGSISAGVQLSCGLRGIWAFCWGQNASGEVGDGTSNSWALPRAVVRGIRFSRIAAGSNITCGLSTEGEAYCWGANAMGSLGIGSTNGPELCEFGGPCSRTPLRVAGGPYVEIDANQHGGWWQFACALTAQGTAQCWGSNAFGALGIGSFTGPGTCRPQHSNDEFPCSALPRDVAGGRAFASLTLGSTHACARTDAGAAFCWGSNEMGQLGDSTTSDRAAPAAVAGGLAFVQLSAGGDHTCGIASDGSAYCWGASAGGALGHGAFAGPEFCQNPDPFQRPYECSTAPVPVVGGHRWSAIGTGWGYSCGLTTAGAVYCWGNNERGQLGTGTTMSTASPLPVAGGLTFVKLAVGASHACGVATDGFAYCWGDNGNYTLGTDEHFPFGLPVRVKGQP